MSSRLLHSLFIVAIGAAVLGCAAESDRSSEHPPSGAQDVDGRDESFEDDEVVRRFARRHRRLRAIGVAFKAFRARHGRDPATLEEFVPDLTIDDLQTYMYATPNLITGKRRVIAWDFQAMSSGAHVGDVLEVDGAIISMKEADFVAMLRGP